MFQSGYQAIRGSATGAWILKFALLLALMALVAFELELEVYIPDSFRTRAGEQENVEPVWSVQMPVSQIMKGPIGLEPDNPDMLQIIREKYLIPPPEGPDRIQNQDPGFDPSSGHADAVREILNNYEGGFYIECGGFDGETWSNSLLFERKFHWDGILIEADINNFKTMMTKNRRAWAMHNCLSTSPYPTEVMFQWGAHASKISSVEATSKEVEGMEKVQCLPIYSVLLAMNVSTVHLFALDVEGNELDVLRTVPWDKLDIWVILVEHINCPGGEAALEAYMEPLGYVSIKEVAEKNQHLFNYDTIFVRSDILAALTKNKA